MLYKNILVPYDGSDHARKALDQAIALAQAGGGAKIHLATFYDVGFDKFEGGEIFASDSGKSRSLEDMEAEVQKKLGKVADSIPEGIERDYHFEFGKPGPHICRVAEEEKCDLIVVGSRGRDFFEEMVLGSVSSYVVHHAKCIVMIVK